MMVAGGVAIAAIFITVLINGHWPEFLKPVQNTAKSFSSYIGDFVWLVWVAVFIGPGWIVQSLGDWLGTRQ
jgi:hypothetical protein